MKETRAYKHLKQIHPQAHWSRIETWTEPGVFDSNACHNGIEVWVECKQAVRPKKVATPVRPPIKKGQVVWEKRRRLAGGMTYVALMVGSTFYMLPGEFIKDLEDGMTEEQIALHEVDPMLIFRRDR